MSTDSMTAPKHPTVSAAERTDMAMLLAVTSASAANNSAFPSSAPPS